MADLAAANVRLAEQQQREAALRDQVVAQAREAGMTEERSRLSREIHDTVAQGLVAIITQLEAAAGEQVPAEKARRLAIAEQVARQSLAEARRAAGRGEVPDATQSDPLGTRGGVVEGIHVHAVRLRGLTAHEEILLGNPGEQLVVRTDSFDRVSFMPGVLYGVRNVWRRPGLTVGLDVLMGLA